MWLKITAAIAMPLVVGAAVGGFLVKTGHTHVPPLSLPSPAPARSNPSQAATPSETAYSNACEGKLPRHFAGIAVNSQIPDRVSQFQQMTKTRVRVLEFYNPFPGHGFQAAEAFQAVKTGAVPLIQLNPRTITMSDVAAGKYDGVIKRYALAVKAFTCDIILSFGHEMNGWWYPWGKCAPAICKNVPQTQPATFIAAWRHIHDIFKAEGAGNVIWSWDPSHQYSQFQAGKVASPASEWYPGDRYVNWVGLDGYMNPGQNFKGVFAYQLASIRSVAGSKPIYLAETGVAKRSPNAVQQIDDLFAGMRSYDLTGLIWFDQNAKQKWELQGRKAAIAEYRRFVTEFK